MGQQCCTADRRDQLAEVDGDGQVIPAPELPVVHKKVAAEDVLEGVLVDAKAVDQQPRLQEAVPDGFEPAPEPSINGAGSDSIRSGESTGKVNAADVVTDARLDGEQTLEVATLERRNSMESSTTDASSVPEYSSTSTAAMDEGEHRDTVAAMLERMATPDLMNQAAEKKDAAKDDTSGKPSQPKKAKISVIAKHESKSETGKGKHSSHSKHGKHAGHSGGDKSATSSRKTQISKPKPSNAKPSAREPKESAPAATTPAVEDAKAPGADAEPESPKKAQSSFDRQAWNALSKEEQAGQALQLIEASSRGDITLVTKLLSSGVKVNAKDEDGRSPLRICAKNNHAEVAKVLISNGAYLDSKNKQKQATALHYACQFNNADVVKVLLDAGASTDAKDKSGKTPLQYLKGSAAA